MRSKKGLGKIIASIVIILALIVCLYPVVWLVMSSFKSTQEFSIFPSYALPKKLIFDNYVSAWTSGNMGSFFKNSIICTLGSLVLIVLIALPVSFALTKMKWKGRKFFNRYFMMGLMIPIQVALIPIFQIYKDMHLLDSHIGLMLVYTVFGLPMTILMFTGFFESFADEILEAAVIDGCSIYGCLTKMVVPLMGNSIVTVLTLQFLNSWNDLLFSQTLISTTAKKTVQAGLLMFSGAHGQIDWGPMFASMAIGVLPTLGLYLFLSKFMIQGMTAGAIKG